MLNLVFEPDTGPLRRILRDFISEAPDGRAIPELKRYALLETVYRPGKVIDAVRQLRNCRNDGTSCHQHQDACAPGRDTSDAQSVSRAGRPLVSGPQEHIRECEPGNGIDRHELHRLVLPGRLVQLHDGHRRSSPAMPVASGPRPRRLPVGARRQKHLRCHAGVTNPVERSRISKIPPTQPHRFVPRGRQKTVLTTCAMSYRRTRTPTPQITDQDPDQVRTKSAQQQTIPPFVTGPRSSAPSCAPGAW